MRGKRVRCGLLALLALCGCVKGQGPSGYQVRIPELQAQPTDYQIGDGVWVRCYLRDDAIAIVTELKAACLAAGGTIETCQAGLVPPPVQP